MTTQTRRGLLRLCNQRPLVLDNTSVYVRVEILCYVLILILIMASNHLSASSNTSCTLAVVTLISPVYINCRTLSTVSGSGPVSELQSCSSTRSVWDSAPSSCVKKCDAADKTERWAEKVRTPWPGTAPEPRTSVKSQNSPAFLCSFCRRESSEQ